MLITGGASGIGEATVRAFAAEGASVLLVDKDAGRGEELAGELVHNGSQAGFLHADLCDEVACQAAVRHTERIFGRIDIVVNNAGINDHAALDRSPDDFAASLQRNLFHVFALTHFARDSLIRARGSIVNVSSKVAVTGQGRTSGYAAAKGGVLALTREWAVTFAADGVRVNCVVPAECDTPMYRDWFEAQPNPLAARAAVEELIPLGRRLTTAEEIAATILFLASARASHTTGQILFVDGGYTHLDRATTSRGGG